MDNATDIAFIPSKTSSKLQSSVRNCLLQRGFPNVLDLLFKDTIIHFQLVDFLKTLDMFQTKNSFSLKHRSSVWMTTKLHPSLRGNTQLKNQTKVQGLEHDACLYSSIPKKNSETEMIQNLDLNLLTSPSNNSSTSFLFP